MTDPGPAIAVRHLSHQYQSGPRAAGRQGPALDDVSFTVEVGEIFGLLGPNGGGKTTLFRILATLLRPSDSGPTSRSQTGASPAAVVFGHDVARDPAAVRRELGVVFQSPSLDIHLTGRENLIHQGRLYGLRGSDLRSRIDRGLEQFDLAARADEPVSNLSGGLRRRLELAKALLHEPRLLLMDEPATGLDPGARLGFWRHLELLRRRLGFTIVLTTHLLDEADRCDRLGILDAGSLVAADTPSALKARIGGDVIMVEPETGPARSTMDHGAPLGAPGLVSGTPEGVNDGQAEQLAQRITERFGPWESGAAPRLVDGCVRFEKQDGAQVVAAIAAAWPGQIRRLTVGQPTLEDVFLHLTGSALDARRAGRE